MQSFARRMRPAAWAVLVVAPSFAVTAAPSQPGFYELGVLEPAFTDSEAAAEYDFSDSVNASDITAFLSGWFSDRTGGMPQADFDRSGTTDAADITAYLNQWFADRAGGGC